ncbi:permease prefix domain 1-containing protein [Brooklawnia sp.]|uniref:permease prefix domain 1-containing protein n=1 Tax=Brooklawnia sp. TaxID=2699740 RepID=UPI00311E1CC7
MSAQPQPNPHEELEAQIAQWRRYVQRRDAISVADVDEMEDHLRERIDELRSVGLDDDESFLVSVKRMGSLDELSREFAREHSDRLWKQLVLVSPEPAGPRRASRELAVMLGLAVAAGLTIKAGLLALSDLAFVMNAALLILPFVAGYLGWKRRLRLPTAAVIAGIFVVLAVALNAYPFDDSGSTMLVATLHAPVVAWGAVGLGYVGGRWRSQERRMDFVRFTGELVIYYVLLALGGGVLLALLAMVLTLADLPSVSIDTMLGRWILPLAAPGAVLVAAWLVEAKQNVVENIAPVLTKVFTPLTFLMLVGCLVALIHAGDLTEADRTLLIVMDAILVLVLGLLLYAVSARDPLAPPQFFDGLQVALLIAAIGVDAVGMAAMTSRIAEFGASPNKVVALGLNVLLLIQLVWSAVLGAGFCLGRRPFAQLFGWQTRFLPAYLIWAGFVVLAIPPIFAFN